MENFVWPMPSVIRGWTMIWNRRLTAQIDHRQAQPWLLWWLDCRWYYSFAAFWIWRNYAVVFLYWFKWKVGDLCLAVYSEDGRLYDAVITSVSPNRGTCMVKYRGYGNEEEQMLKDLVPSTNGNRNANISEAESDLPSEVCSVNCLWLWDFIIIIRAFL